MSLTAVLLSLTLSATEGAPQPTSPPSATEAVSPAAEPTPPNLTIGLKAGGIFPQVMNKLSSTYSFALEVGWLLPFLNHQLAIVVEGAYSAPPRTLTVDDPRVATGSYKVTLTERTIGVYVGPKYYFLPLRGTFIPWISIGVRAQFIDSQVVGGTDQAFGQHDETGTHFAFGGQAGIGYHLGPGFIGLEVQLISSPLDHLVTGKVDVGDLAVRAAYHLAF